MTVTDSNGFNLTDNGFWEWRGDEEPPTFTYLVDLRGFEDSQVGSDWGIVHQHHVDPGIAIRGNRSIRLTTPTGYVAENKVLLGTFVRHTEPGRVGPVSVVMSTELDVERNATAVAKQFAAVTRRFRISNTSQHTTLFVVPSTYRGPWGKAGDRTVTIRVAADGGRALWDGLMAHEYLHTRQEFKTTDSMEWVIESSAFYYHGLVPYHHGKKGWDDFVDRISGRRLGRDLVHNYTYQLARDPGPLVTAAIDRKIRAQTGGQATFQDVLRRMNKRENVSYQDFKNIVSATAGTKLDGWLDARLTGEVLPAPLKRGQFPPAEWTPNAELSLYQCIDGQWTTLSGPYIVGEPTKIVYTGWGNLTANVPIEQTDITTFSHCSVTRLPANARAYELLPTRNVTFTVTSYYDGADTVTLPVVEPTPTPTPTSSQADQSSTDNTATLSSTPTPTETVTPATTAGPTSTTIQSQSQPRSGESSGSSGAGFILTQTLLAFGVFLTWLRHRGG